MQDQANCRIDASRHHEICNPQGSDRSLRLGYPCRMLEGLLFLKPLHLNRDGTCTDWDVREHKPNGRTVGRIYLDISTGGQWLWCTAILHRLLIAAMRPHARGRCWPSSANGVSADR